MRRLIVLTGFCLEPGRDVTPDAVLTVPGDLSDGRAAQKVANGTLRWLPDPTPVEEKPDPTPVEEKPATPSMSEATVIGPSSTSGPHDRDPKNQRQRGA